MVLAEAVAAVTAPRARARRRVARMHRPMHSVSVHVGVVVTTVMAPVADVPRVIGAGVVATGMVVAAAVISAAMVTTTVAAG